MRELDPLRVARADREGRPRAHRDAEDRSTPPLSRARRPQLRGARTAREEPPRSRSRATDLVLRVHLDERRSVCATSRRARRDRRRRCSALRFLDGGGARPHRGGEKKRAGVWLVAQAQLDERPRPPRARRARPRRRGARRDPAPRATAASSAPPRPARDRRDRPRACQRDPPPRAALAVQGLDGAVAGRDRSVSHAATATTTLDARSSCASRERATRSSTASTTGSASRARSAARRSRAWTSRSTRSTTARAARREAGC